MSPSDLDLVLAELSLLPKGTTLRAAMRKLGATEPEEVLAAKRQCALVRWFDERLYNCLTGGLAQRPEFLELTRSAGMQTMGPGRYALDESERARLLSEWQSDDASWRSWNLRIGAHFLLRDGADEQLCAVYHLAVSPEPIVVIPFFEMWYQEADSRFDTAQCHALLEMLRLQQRFRGPSVSAVWLDRTRYFSTRMMFADDFYKTGSYFERKELLAKFESVLQTDGKSAPWIFHVHATGGAGKTMFLRWLLSRYLSLRRIPCARVDFDDFKPLNQVIDTPLRLLVRVVEQLSQQVEGLDALLEKLNSAETSPGWNPGIMNEVKLQLAGAKLKTLVVSLDTLEEATLSHTVWLKDCVSELRKVREDVPGLKLILAGRYDLAERSQVLVDGEYVPYAIPPFTKLEAHAYLGMRGIPEGAVRDAVVARSSDDDGEPEDDRLSGGNPFKLAMLAEIVLHRDFTPQDIFALPRADIAYLLERVIRRIDSQPLRWMIRYGAIARHLTEEFAESVLLPPLRRALRGKVQDQPAVDLDAEYQDTWTPDPELADKVSAAKLWPELRKYARDRGWISQVKVDGKDGLRFHPEVVRPTRDLLSKQKIFRPLQKRASYYFEKCSSREGISETERLRRVREAIFHRFQMQTARVKPRRAKPDDAWRYWEGQVSRAAQFSPGRAAKTANEVLGPDYAEAERKPLPGIMTAEHLCEAHCTMANLLLREAGIRFAKGVNRQEFLRHVESAEAIAVDSKIESVPTFLRAMARAWSANSSDATLALLESAISVTAEPGSHFKLMLQTAQLLAERRSVEAVKRFKEALGLLEGTPDTGVAGAEINLELAAFYAFEGQHTAVIGNLSEARQRATGNPPLMAQVLESDASYSLAVGDVDAAATRISELAKVPAEHYSTPGARHVLEARLALANGDPFAARAAIEAGRRVSMVDLDTARLLDQEGEVEAMLLNFATALDRFESASVRYDLARVLTGSVRCKVLSSRLLARVMQNYPEAEAVLRSAWDLPGSRDAELRCELLMLQAFVAKSKDETPGVAEAVKQLLAKREPPWPPPLRARAMMFVLLSGREVPEEFLEELIETLADVQPPTLRDRALEWSAYFWTPAKVPDRFGSPLTTMFTRSRAGSVSGARRGIARAHLLRLLGRREAAVKPLDETERGLTGVAGEAAVILEWELNEARLKLSDKTAYGELAGRAHSSRLEGTMFFDVIRASFAREAHDTHAARDITRLGDGPGNVFEAERLNWLATLPDATAQDRDAAREYRARLGWTEAKKHGTVGFAIQAAGLPPPLLDAADTIEVAITRLLQDWKGFATDLSEAFKAAGLLPEVVAIEPEARLSSLPWEMASVLNERRKVHRTSASAPPAVFPPQPILPRRSVLYVGPDENLRGVLEALGPSSGGSIEEFYARYNASPGVLLNADPRLLQETIKETPEVTLIHVACTLRETSGGIYLDIEGTRERGLSFALDWQDTSREVLDLHLNVSRVDRALQQLQIPPFVVLDVANPFNTAEAIRMLLLRNRFAEQLFDLGHARGILGCGLASPGQRYDLSQATVNALMTKSVGETLADLRGPSDSLENLLPGPGAALWTNNPDDRLFATGM